MGLAAAAVVGAVAITSLGVNVPPTTTSTPAASATTPAVPAPPGWPTDGAGRPSGGRNGQPVTSAGGTSTASAALSRGVVLIESTMATGGTGAGTGMVLTASGQVLTNYHVVEQSTSVTVTIADTGDTYEADVLGRDATADVALLQLRNASGLATVTLDDDPVAVGSAVTAVGNSKGAGRLTAASGVVTDASTTITVSSESSASGSETLAGVIATDASAVPGDSGGPMFDAEGEVLGMTTAGSQQQGRRGSAVTVASFAVPIDAAMDVVGQIRSGQESGTTDVGGRAYLGVTVAGSGLVLGTVEDGTPAASAGLEAGDTITAVDGTAVATRAELAAVLAALQPGDRVSVAWLDTAGQSRSATLTLGTSPIN